MFVSDGGKKKRVKKVSRVRTESENAGIDREGERSDESRIRSRNAPGSNPSASRCQFVGSTRVTRSESWRRVG